MSRVAWLFLAVALPTEAIAIVAVPGNVGLFGEQRLLTPLVPQFKRCGAKKIIFRRNGKLSELYVDQNPKDVAVFSCVKRVARNVRWQAQLHIGKYGKYEI